MSSSIAHTAVLISNLKLLSFPHYVHRVYSVIINYSTLWLLLEMFSCSFVMNVIFSKENGIEFSYVEFFEKCGNVSNGAANKPLTIHIYTRLVFTCLKNPSTLLQLP